MTKRLVPNQLVTGIVYIKPSLIIELPIFTVEAASGLTMVTMEQWL
jgi:hypothetical protein